MMHLAAGTSKYFTNERRSRDIVEGHADACNISGCAWGGGESPTLRDIIYPGTAVFAGSATGIINPKSNLLLGSRVEVNDAIIFASSSGIHANGLTLAQLLDPRKNLEASARWLAMMAVMCGDAGFGAYASGKCGGGKQYAKRMARTIARIWRLIHARGESCS